MQIPNDQATKQRQDMLNNIRIDLAIELKYRELMKAPDRIIDAETETLLSEK